MAKKAIMKKRKKPAEERVREKNLLIKERYYCFRTYRINKTKMIFGAALASLGKMMLESGGAECDFKINGENIDDIKELKNPDIEQKILLAVSQERYEDAARLKKLLDNKKRIG